MKLTEEEVKLDEELKILEARKINGAKLSPEEEARLAELQKAPKKEEPKEEAPKREEPKEEVKPTRPSFTTGQRNSGPFGRGSR